MAAPLKLLAFVLPIMLILTGRTVATLFILLGLWALFAWWKALWQPRAFWREPLFHGTLALLGWWALSNTWALFPQEAASTLGRGGVILLAGSLMVIAASRLPLTQATYAAIEKAFLLGMVTAVCCIFTVLLGDGGIPRWLSENFSRSGEFSIHSLKRGNLILAVLVWPLYILLLARGKTLAAALALLFALLLLWLMPSHTAIVSMSASLGLYLVLSFCQARWQYLLCGATLIAMWAGLFLLLPQMPLPSLTSDSPWLQFSFIHRLHIWDFTIANILEHPLRGWGIRATDGLPHGEALLHSLHPHNNFLQAWLDLGLPGVLAYVALAFMCLRAIHRQPLPCKRIRAAAYACLTCMLVGGMSGFGLWQSWWLSSNVLVAVLLICFLRGIAAKGTETAIPHGQ